MKNGNSIMNLPELCRCERTVEVRIGRSRTIMYNIYKQFYFMFAVIGVTAVLVVSFVGRGIALRNNGIAKFHTVKNDYEVYLDGQKIDADNIDVINYKISFDDENKKVLLTKSLRGSFYN